MITGICLNLNSVRVTFLQSEHITRHDNLFITIYCVTNNDFRRSTQEPFAICIAR